MEREELEQIAQEAARQAVEEALQEHDALLALHALEHEATGAARLVDPRKARDPSIPCRCFDFEGESYCWKRGYLGLISSQRNPEQIRDCIIRVPASGRAAERFRRIKGAVGRAHREWAREGGDLARWWEKAGEKLGEEGVEL